MDGGIRDSGARGAQPGVDADVVICGAGLAGLTLARQLRIEHPGVSVVLIDRLQRPLPEAAFKVGESTVELAAHYLRDMLGLADYLDRAHLRKLGLRFFFRNREGEPRQFAARPEIGLSKFASIPTHQIDRGRLEQDLRAMVEEDGVRLIEGARIADLEIGTGGSTHHVTYYHDDTGPEPQHLTARWLIDASGRSRMVQRQLGLAKQRERDHHAVWFRVRGKLDVDDLVPRSNRAWHDRVPGGKRFLSTNHLAGTGYWVWIIPLPSGHTSVGIVADRTFHPFDDLRSRDRAAAWLARNEPEFAALMAGHEMLDFCVLRNYSHTSERVFSVDRWACTGDAGVFADPMYSPGTDLIAFGNCCISWMIGEDAAGRLTPEAVEEKSRFMITIGELLTRSIQVNYHLLGAPETMAAKLFWDITAGWAVVQPLMFGKVFLDRDRHAAVRAASRNFFFMSLQMNALFSQWAAMGKGNLGFDFIDYFEVDAIRAMRERNLVPDKSLEELVADQHANMALLEELAICLFRLAVADVHPEHLHRVEDTWINATAITLDPSQWEERGLFRPRTAPRDLSHFSDPLERLFRVRKLQH